MTAFLSYPHDANEQDAGAIIALCEALEREVQILTGRPFVILRDKKDIQWGNRWREFVEQRPETASLLLPVMTESYFKSGSCHKEYLAFRRLERFTGRNDLMLPLLYTDIIPADKEEAAKIRTWKIDMMARQYIDWRPLRCEAPTGSQFRRAIAELGLRIRDILIALKPLPTSAAKTRVGTPGRANQKSSKKFVPTPPLDTPHKSDSIYRFVGSGNSRELHVLDTQEKYYIDYSPIMSANLDQFQIVRSEFEAIVARELLSHRLMLKYDYESRAIPLLGGLTVFVTKSDKRIVLEWLTKRQPSAELDEAWHRLCRAYYVATRLPYRADPRLLVNKRVRSEAIDRISELVAEAQRFFVETTRMASRNALPAFETRSSGADNALVEAESAAETLEHREGSDDTLIGRLVVPLEVAISNIHKMMIEYGKYQKV